MPPTIQLEPSPNPDKGKKLKAFIRHSLHILHLITAILTLTIVILNLVSDNARSPFILYLVPLVISVVIIELCYLCHHTPPKKLRDGFYGHRSLIRRAFHYQLAGVIGIGLNKSNRCRDRYQNWYRDDEQNAAFAISITVFVIGVVLFSLGWLAHEGGFEDWVEEPEPQGAIKLHDVESAEDLSQVLASP